jgi:enoyl-CoA hydratase/carnithine racemase
MSDSGRNGGSREPGRQEPPGVRFDLVGGVAHIGFDRPPVNAFTVDMLRQLRGHLERAAKEPRPVLLTGGSGRFSAGFDVRQPDIGDAATDEEARGCVAAIKDHPAPVVAAVEGVAVGLGLLIALSADILVISRSAKLGMPEVKLGIDSDVATLRRFLPDPWIRRMCLSGETFIAADLRLDYCAGATVCEPGETERAATAILGSFAGIETAFLERTKRRLAAYLST